jgi:hypothetical protein
MVPPLPDPTEPILGLIQALASIRACPQIYFFDEISYESLLKVREIVIALKERYPAITEVDFLIHSPGGGPDEAYKIIRTLRKNFETVNIIVPFWAKSAATLLSLGGSSIIMDEFAEFGPIDVQLVKERDDSPLFDHESALNDDYSLKIIEVHAQLLYEQMFTNFYENQRIPVNKNDLSSQIFEYMAKFYNPLLSQINPYKLGDKKRKLEIGGQYARKILEFYQKELSIKERVYLTDFLVNGCPDHGYVIDFDHITQYMPSVVKLSTTFGEKYKKALSTLSEYLMALDRDINFIGIVENYKDDVIEGRTDKSNQSESKSNIGVPFPLGENPVNSLNHENHQSNPSS